ncbi:SulP family inorganic anion transporter [Cyclobacteriaceae bacterium]|nr:SulP family inorganic anion transporter [Cyclobacteriaceae bacterium]|tara:strand:+ start:606 stop:2438 length:1833 start_codon:yes stop_codon:yes gene_type:complete
MFSRIKNYFDFTHFKGDLFGGLTAGVVALPLALAFGVSSGLGAAAGLYGAIFVSFFAALFGGTQTQISGPTAPMTAVSMTVIAGVMASFDGDLSQAFPSIMLIFLLAGCLQIVLGLSGLGTYVRYIPNPVVSGFMTAIGVMIIVTQMLPALGYYPNQDQALIKTFKAQAEENILEKILVEEVMEDVMVLENFDETIARAQNVPLVEIQKESKLLATQYSNGVVGTLKVLPRAIGQIKYTELMLCTLTILLIFGFKRITTSVPSTLIALLVVSTGAYLLNIAYLEINKIPSGLPDFNLGILYDFNLVEMSPFLFSAVTLALLGAIDSLLTSVVADNLTNTKHAPNKELLGQGIGNSIAAFFGGIPGAGATIRTVVNIRAGGKTRLSGMMAGLFLLFILLAIGPIASKIPAAVLAGILITVGIDVMDYKGLKGLLKMPRSESVILLGVLLLAVFWNLVFAVGLGLIFAALVFMKKTGDIGAEKMTIIPGASLKEGFQLSEEELSGVYVQDLFGPLFFGLTHGLTEFLDKNHKVETVIMRFERVAYMDQSGLELLHAALATFHRQKIKVLFTGLSGQPKKLYGQSGAMLDGHKGTASFDDLKACGVHLKTQLT